MAVQGAGGFQVEPKLVGVCDLESVEDAPARDAPDETVEQTLEDLRVGRTDAMKSRTVLLQRIDPVQNQHVQAHIDVQRAAETLDQGDDAGSNAAAGRETCAVRQMV